MGALVLEVNGVAAWRRLQRATDIDIAALLVDDLLSRKCRAAPGALAPSRLTARALVPHHARRGSWQALARSMSPR